MTKAQLQSEIARLQAELTESRRLLAMAIEALQRAAAATVPISRGCLPSPFDVTITPFVSVPLPIQPSISWLQPSSPEMHRLSPLVKTPLGAGTTTVMCR